MGRSSDRRRQGAAIRDRRLPRNDFITGRLLEGAEDALVQRRRGGRYDIAWVQRFRGRFAAQARSAAAARARPLRRDHLPRRDHPRRPHFDYWRPRSPSLAQIMLEGPAPVINGVVLADTVDQAVERAGAKLGNKGFSAALSALEMSDLAARLRA
jgi:6,7-dimethyl-8-ribityllumazine synthase